MEPHLSKQALRERMKEAVRAMSREDMAAQSSTVCEKIAELERFKRAGTVLLYMPLKDECDITPLIQLAYAQNKTVVFPRCEGEHDMGLYAPKTLSCMAAGRYGILEPDVLRSRRVDMEDVELAVIPGMAFDRYCGRLGRGAGYYDRALHGSNIYKVGVGFDCRMAERVPSDTFDVPMDCVVCGGSVFFRQPQPQGGTPKED